jgi:membrane protein
MTEPDLTPSFYERGRDRVLAGLGHLWHLISNAVQRLFDHHGTQLAAGMAYYALLSVFPTAIVFAAGAGFILDDPNAREDVVNYLLRELPLSEGSGREDIESLLDGVTANSGTLGVIGFLALLVSASALISAARNSVNVAFEEDERRGALRGKGLDLLLVLGLGVLFALSFATTVVTQLDISFDDTIGSAIQSILDATGTFLPVILTAFVFGVLYRVLPSQRPPLRDIWPGVVFAAIGYELLKRGFSFYLENFANYSAVYGSLGAVIAFMFFVFLASIVFLIGAEMAAIWPRVRAGEFDSDPDQESDSLGVQIRRFLAGLVKSGRPKK